MEVSVYDNFVSPLILPEIDKTFTRKEWQFIVDDGEVYDKPPFSLGLVLGRNDFAWIEDYLINELDQRGFDTSKITRSIHNCFQRGDITRYHQDPGTLTYMFFLNLDWKRHWGSPIKFKSKKYHLSRKVMPKPGRMVIFNSKLWHKGTAPTFLFTHNIPGRFSMVLQGEDPADE